MKELQVWRRQYAAELVGESPKFVEALRTAAMVADSEVTVVITGETGTGKDLLARTMHRASARRHKPYIPINCAAFQDTLLETELFGHVRGAFTGASQARPGRFLAANGGTIFLDEVGELSAAAQAKLLRVLEDRTVTPVGSDLPVAVDVRVVAATHRDLQEMVEEGTFRRDLYYRLCVVQLELPPLRERGSDIDLITDMAITRECEKRGKVVEGVEAAAREMLRAHPWPGNVRELQHCLERVVLLSNPGPVRLEDLRLPPVRGAQVPGADRASIRTLLGDSLDPKGVAKIVKSPSSSAEGAYDLRAVQERVERFMITQALTAAGGNKTEAAALLGLNRTTLVEKIRKYGV